MGDARIKFVESSIDGAMKGIKVLVFTDELLFEMGGSGQWSLIKVFPRASIESLRMSSSPMVGNGPLGLDPVSWTRCHLGYAASASVVETVAS